VAGRTYKVVFYPGGAPQLRGRAEDGAVVVADHVPRREGAEGEEAAAGGAAAGEDERGVADGGVRPPAAGRRAAAEAEEPARRAESGQLRGVRGLGLYAIVSVARSGHSKFEIPQVPCLFLHIFHLAYDFYTGGSAGGETRQRTKEISADAEDSVP
jgi:hypothetical protein